ncbi:unnamed protein product [Paramecium octaurelia]|uniref:Uncharacterized protein n=1 Tax=Paramecium octaurelia TaxID=43137 RepID=A0A8S1W726_PAROT|nr:unnamed protein product [Paramecium octaurelia]
MKKVKDIIVESSKRNVIPNTIFLNIVIFLIFIKYIAIRVKLALLAILYLLKDIKALSIQEGTN